MSLGLKEHDEFVKTACHYYMASSHMNCVKKFYIKKMSNLLLSDQFSLLLACYLVD